MGKIIKMKSNDLDRFDKIGLAGEYTAEELANFDVKNFIDFDKLNEEVRALQIPEGQQRLRMTIEINLNFVNADKKHKYVSSKEAMDKIATEKNKLGV
jgi:hypothetical protein